MTVRGKRCLTLCGACDLATNTHARRGSDTFFHGLQEQEITITTACDNHGSCGHAKSTRAAYFPRQFLAPIVCLMMVVVGASIEHLSPASTSETAAWTTGRVVAQLAYVIAYVAGGIEVLGHALQDLRRGRITIDMLMILAAIGAATIGDWAEGAVLLFLFSLSHAMESFILGRTRRAISELMDLSPDEAVVLRDGLQVRIPTEQLVVGDTVVVMPSARIPADGRVTLGFTTIDQSPMTGESIPVEKKPGDEVFAGTLNHEGSIQLEVTRVAGQTTLARIVALVEQAQSERATSQQFTDWFGQRYTWIVLAGVAVVLLVGIYVWKEPWERAFYRAMTVLVVTSPCAVVISIPAALLSAIASAARGGVLFKGGVHLERAAGLRSMAFDKTGTLTLGKPHVVEVLAATRFSENELLNVAAALECQSEHPLAQAIVERARESGVSIQAAEEVQSVVGHGIIGTFQSQHVRAGKLAWFADEGIPIADELRDRASLLQSEGRTIICVGDDRQAWGLIAVADTVRPTALPALTQLREMGLSPLVMISGDHVAVAKRMGEELQIDAVGGLLPQDKLQIIQSLKRDHGPIGMIGDGMNDAPSLAAADVGFSLGGAGTDVALETADIVLLADDLRRLPYSIALARRTQQIIRQNLIFSFGTMGTLLFFTLVSEVPLPLAVFGHEGSTVAVILNGLRLLSFPKPGVTVNGRPSP